MRRRLALLLPPVVVAGAIALILTRSIEVKDRIPREAAIKALLWNRGDWLAAEKDVDRFLADFGADPSARWFAAEAYGRVWMVAKAFDAVWDDPRIAEDPETPHRFADMMLHALGGPPGDPTKVFARCLLIRVEGHEEAARTELYEIARNIVPSQASPLFELSHRVPSEAPRVLADGFLSRKKDPLFPIAGAALMICPAQRDRADIVIRRLAAPWALPELGMWTQVVRAVGISGDPRAAETMRRAKEALSGDPRVVAKQSMILDVGLSLAGDAGARAKVIGEARGASDVPEAGRVYAEGLVHQMACGEPTALERVIELWDGPLRFEARLELGAGCLLADPPPPPGLPTDAWIEELESQSVPVGVAVAHAYRWRTRKRDDRAALKPLLEDLRVAVHHPTVREMDSDGEGTFSSVIMEVLRAWYRWPNPKP